MASLPLMYGDLAAWWPLLSPPEDYADEAGYIAGLLREAGLPEGARLLELGCGGGHNAFHLREQFQLTLTDISAGMLAVSAALNPACEHLLGDMRTLRLGRAFDGVLIHDAINYMVTMDDLNAVLATAALHLAPGGVLLLMPDNTAESFMEKTTLGGHSDAERGIRYLQWTHDPDPDDGQYTLDFAYILHAEEGQTTHLHDVHVCGLFEREHWLEALSASDFDAQCIHDPWGRDLFVGLRQP